VGHTGQPAVPNTPQVRSFVNSNKTLFHMLLALHSHLGFSICMGLVSVIVTATVTVA
jgi:hypothetical protein